MPILSSIVNWVNTKRLHQIDLFRKYPYDVQRDGLMRLLGEAKDTWIGKKYGFSEIRTIEKFQERVPLSNYEDLQPVIKRVMSGEPNLLWPSEVKWFAKSSGTTSEKSKFIPVTQEALEECHFRGGKDVIAIYCQNYPDNKILTGKGLTLGGSHQINSYSNQSFYGDLSAIIIENLPFWAQFIRTPSQEVALLSEWEEKMDIITRETIRDNVTSLSGVPSWNLVLIKYILEFTGKSSLLEVWPNLELFLHGGVSFTPYREQFEKLIPSSQMNYMEVYNASEGHFSIQDEPDKDDMLLMLDYGVFFEFIPAGKVSDPDARALTLNDVVCGENYAIVISTNGGLWRYMIGDTIVFTSTSPHKIKISGRTKHFINAFGEEVIIENAEKALDIACSKTGAVIHEFTAAPIFMGDDQKGSHEWLIEFEKSPSDLDYFTSVLDNALCSINSDYEAKRYKGITLEMPTVRNMPQGTFYKWLRVKGKLGGQNKVPRLSNDRKFVEEILSLETAVK
ncbi:MAG TPA: GH3 auxin-responsive promoter family protein [Bacteroides sp.]|nr:GH3 auxin-responsive promoter family protein [Bacteroides sp.]